MSVKQEHRYYKWVLETGRAVTDRQREIEAATMERKPRLRDTAQTECQSQTSPVVDAQQRGRVR